MAARHMDKLATVLFRPVPSVAVRCVWAGAADYHAALMAAEGLVAGLVALLGDDSEACKSSAAEAIANIAYNGMSCWSVRIMCGLCRDRLAFGESERSRAGLFERAVAARRMKKPRHSPPFDLCRVWLCGAYVRSSGLSGQSHAPDGCGGTVDRVGGAAGRRQ